MKIDDLPEDEYISVIGFDGQRRECRILGNTLYDGDECVVCEETTGEHDIFVADSRGLRGQQIPVNEPTVTMVVEQFKKEHPEQVPEHFIKNQSVIVLTDEHGKDLQMEVLDLIDEDGKCYVVCLDAEEEESEEVIIFQVNELDNEEEYFFVDDEELFEHLFEIFQSRNAERFNFV